MVLTQTDGPAWSFLSRTVLSLRSDCHWVQNLKLKLPCFMESVGFAKDWRMTSLYIIHLYSQSMSEIQKNLTNKYHIFYHTIMYTFDVMNYLFVYLFPSYDIPVWHAIYLLQTSTLCSCLSECERKRCPECVGELWWRLDGKDRMRSLGLCFTPQGASSKFTATLHWRKKITELCQKLTEEKTEKTSVVLMRKSKSLLRLSFKIGLLSQDGLENVHVLARNFQTFKDVWDGGLRQMALCFSRRSVLQKDIFADLVICLHQREELHCKDMYVSNICIMYRSTIIDMYINIRGGMAFHTTSRPEFLSSPSTYWKCGYRTLP